MRMRRRACRRHEARPHQCATISAIHSESLTWLLRPGTLLQMLGVEQPALGNIFEHEVDRWGPSTAAIAACAVSGDNMFFGFPVTRSAAVSGVE
jgi:hypothetical protein